MPAFRLVPNEKKRLISGRQSFYGGKIALNRGDRIETIRQVMERFADPEDAANEFELLDNRLTSSGKTLLVTFDALDTISREWKRSTLLIDALFEVIWALRARRSIRAKLFIRPEQLNDDALRFVELPKLRSGRVELEWKQLDLYGLLYWRLSDAPDPGRQWTRLSWVGCGSRRYYS